MVTPQDIYQKLDEMGIPYEVTDHPAVYTIEEMDQLQLCALGEVCKNLFLRDARGKRHFLVSIPGHKQVNLAQLAQQLGSSRLSFASTQRLMDHLGLEKGSVTPLGVLNDSSHQVEVVFDRELRGFPRLGVHPNRNTATVWLSFAGLEQVVASCGNPITYVTL